MKKITKPGSRLWQGHWFWQDIGQARGQVERCPASGVLWAWGTELGREDGRDRAVGVGSAPPDVGSTI